MLDITLRDGMVIVGSLLILAVAVDAWRRMRQQQRSRVRVKLASDLPDEEVVDDLSLYRELPNGGARVVRRDEAGGEPLGGDEERLARAPGAGDGPAMKVPSRPATPPPREPAPQAADPAEKAGAKGAKKEAAKDQAKKPGKDPAKPGAAAASTVSTEARGSSGAASDTKDSDGELSALAGVRARDEEPANLDWLEDLPESDDSVDDQGAELPRSVETEVIVLHVTARDDRGFAGQDILEILLACDLRFGDMNFFHRHEQKAGRGPIQFSVANMLQPGVFDIDNMGSMTTRGLVFFLTLPGPEDMIFAFDCMLETARTVARNLGGELLDASRSVLTQQAVEHSRQQIRELDRRLRARQN